MIQTELTRALGIRVPIVQGGMQWVGTPKLVAAVSNAGGLGILTGLTPGSPAKLREAIRKTKEMCGKNPFGVNLTFLPSISPPPYKEYAQIVIDEGVKIAETAGGPEAGPVIKMYKEAGIIVLHKCTSIRHAKTAANKFGVDWLSIDGFECAGHPGEDDVPGLVLLARAAEELRTPFIASGGFANGQGLAAALALGAQGINCGTLFMATVESEIHDNIKQELVKADERQTVHMFRTLNNTARVYKNKVSEEVVRLERRPGGAKFEDLRELVSGARGRTVYETGDVDAGVWSAGIAQALIHDIPTCDALIKRIERQAEETITRMAGLVGAQSKL